MSPPRLDVAKGGGERRRWEVENQLRISDALVAALVNVARVRRRDPGRYGGECRIWAGWSRATAAARSGRPHKLPTNHLLGCAKSRWLALISLASFSTPVDVWTPHPAIDRTQEDKSTTYASADGKLVLKIDANCPNRFMGYATIYAPLNPTPLDAIECTSQVSQWYDPNPY